eukprot:4431296-Pleurochrysis_carterae.AAC.2
MHVDTKRRDRRRCASADVVHARAERHSTSGELSEQSGPERPRVLSSNKSSVITCSYAAPTGAH